MLRRPDPSTSSPEESAVNALSTDAPLEAEKIVRTIGFRISEHYSQVLAERAAAAGVSVHAWARFVLIQVLEKSEELSTKEDLAQLREELAAFREEFREALSD